MVLISILWSLSVADPTAPLSDALLGSEGGVCLATGYCSTPGRGAEMPGGFMYLALGLVGTGITVLRTQSRKATSDD